MRVLASIFSAITLASTLAACSSAGPESGATWSQEGESVTCQGEGIHLECTVTPPTLPTNPSAATCAKYDPSCTISSVTWAAASPKDWDTNSPDTAFTNKLVALGCTNPRAYNPYDAPDFTAVPTFIATCPSTAVNIVNATGHSPVDITSLCDRCTGATPAGRILVQWDTEECAGVDAGLKCHTPSGCRDRSCIKQ